VLAWREGSTGSLSGKERTMRTGRRRVLWVLAVLTVVGAICATATEETPRVLFVLPAVGNLYLPHLLISQELFPVVDMLEEHGVIVEFTGPERAVYSLPLNEAGDRRREVTVKIPADEIDLSRYDIVAIAGGHAHQYLSILVEPMLGLLVEAYGRGITLAGLSQGAMALNDTGLLVGRTIARCPMAIGIVYCHNTIPAMEKAGTTISESECLVVSEGRDGESTVITATYRCVYAFARALLRELGIR
jgi:putative intracellular protease/amidase